MKTTKTSRVGLSKAVRHPLIGCREQQDQGLTVTTGTGGPCGWNWLRGRSPWTCDIGILAPQIRSEKCCKGFRNLTQIAWNLPCWWIQFSLIRDKFWFTKGCILTGATAWCEGVSAAMWSNDLTLQPDVVQCCAQSLTVSICANQPRNKQFCYRMFPSVCGSCERWFYVYRTRKWNVITINKLDAGSATVGIACRQSPYRLKTPTWLFGFGHRPRQLHRTMNTLRSTWYCCRRNRSLVESWKSCWYMTIKTWQGGYFLPCSL